MSLEQILKGRKGDPEQFLTDLGFGKSSVDDTDSRIPKRFIRHQAMPSTSTADIKPNDQNPLPEHNLNHSRLLLKQIYYHGAASPATPSISSSTKTQQVPRITM